MTTGEKAIWAAVFVSELSKVRLVRGDMPGDHIAAVGSAGYAVRELRDSVEKAQDMHGTGSDTVKMLQAMLDDGLIHDGAERTFDRHAREILPRERPDTTVEWFQWIRSRDPGTIKMLKGMLHMHYDEHGRFKEGPVRVWPEEDENDGA